MSRLSAAWVCLGTSLAFYFIGWEWATVWTRGLSLGLAAAGFGLTHWEDRRRPTVWLMVAGILCNLAVVVANQGLMPVVHPRAGATLSNWHVAAGPEHRLLWLADRDVLWYGSPGDVLIIAGVVGAVWTWVYREASPFKRTAPPAE